MRKSHVLGVTALALLAWLLVALAFVWARTARADETAVGYTNADTTLYVAPNALGQGSCASAANACTPAGAVAAIHNTPFLKNRVKVVFAAGSYSNNAVDWYTVGTGNAGNPLLWLRGTPSTPTLDGGITSGLCNWTTGTAPTRATCNAGADGGWAPGGLVPFWARFGGVSSTFPDGTCGTYVVQSNTSTTVTLELPNDSRGMPAPSGCTGSLPFAVLAQGTHFAQRTAPTDPTRFPPFTVGNPDGGPSNNLTSVAELAPYQLGLTGSSAWRENGIVVDWIDFQAGTDAGAVLSARLAPGTHATFTHDEFQTETDSAQAGAGIYLEGGNRLLVMNSRADRVNGAATGGALLKSRQGAVASAVRAFGNVGLNVNWWDFRGPTDYADWIGNYLDTPVDSAYSHDGVRWGRIRSDVVTDAGVPYQWNWGSLAFTPRPMGSALEFNNSTWEGTGGGGAVHSVFNEPGARVYISGTSKISFPSANAALCPDMGAQYELSGNGLTFSATNFADYSPGCSGANYHSLADVDAGISCGQGSAQPCLCGLNAGADGGLSTLGAARTGCIQLFTP